MNRALKCLDVLDKIYAARKALSLEVRFYCVRAIVLSKLCYAATVIRPTVTQVQRLRGRIARVLCDTPMANSCALLIFGHKGHACDPVFAPLYASLCAWERYFAKHGSALLLQAQDIMDGNSRPNGPVSRLREDTKALEWTFSKELDGFVDRNGHTVWKLGVQTRGPAVLSFIASAKMPRLC